MLRQNQPDEGQRLSFKEMTVRPTAPIVVGQTFTTASSSNEMISAKN